MKEKTQVFLLKALAALGLTLGLGPAALLLGRFFLPGEAAKWYVLWLLPFVWGVGSYACSGRMRLIVDLLGLIPLGWCNVTLYVIPVAIGTLLMGTKSGLILGLAFAGVSFASVLMKPSVLVASLMASSMPLVIVMTFVPRLCIPLVIRGVYRLMPKKNKHVAYAVSAAAGSLTNTVLYLGMMLLFYVICGIDNTAVLSAIAATAGGAGPCEAVAAALVCPPVLRALEKTKIGKSMNQ